MALVNTSQADGGAMTTETLNLIKANGVNPIFNSVTVGPSGGITEQPGILSVNGAINPHASATYVITKAGVLADTLAAPTATTDDGVTITITSNTAFAHTITATGLMQTGTATVNLATFAAFAGATITFYAYQGKWNVSSLNAVVLT